MKHKGEVIVNSIGAFMTLFGLSGMSDAITGHGSFLVSSMVFSIGLGICLWNLFEGREE